MRPKRRKKKPTDIEKIVETVLIASEIRYKREYKVGNYNVDFYLPEYNLSIQCDSKYWHGPCKNCKETGTKEDARQYFQSRRDRSCITYHRHVKVNLIRLCECLIKQEEELVKILSKYIDRVSKGESVYLDRKK